MSCTEFLEREYRRRIEEQGYRAPSLETWTSMNEKLTSDMIDWTASEGLLDAHSIDRGQHIRKTTPPTGSVPLNMIIGPLAAEVESAAEEWAATKWHMKLPLPVYCGVFPTGQFNAVVDRVEDGALILINEGLAYLIFQVFEVWALRSSLSSLADGPLGGQILSENDAVEALANIVQAYLSTGSSAAAPQLPMIGGVRGYYAHTFALSTLKFVVAHELGHAYAGHLTDRESDLNRRLQKAEPESTSTWWKVEYEADLLAMRLVMPPSVRSLNSMKDQVRIEVTLLGPLAFFQIAQLLEMVRCALLGQTELPTHESHPPPVLRSKHIRIWAKQQAAGKLLTLADRVCEWIAKSLAQIAIQTGKSLGR